MSSYINTNMVSLNTQNNLTKSQGALATSIQRLSSGLRVNGAKDDAAGFAIASGMESNIKGQTVAVRNANDAISFSQTAEGALTTIGNNLQRMRELAVQAANGTNSDADNGSLNTEFQQLQQEISRVSNNTKFNGNNVFNGADKVFQIGSGTSTNDQITVKGINLGAGTALATATSQTAAKQGLTDAFGTDSAGSGIANISFNPTTGQANLTTGTVTITSQQQAALDNYNAAATSFKTGLSSTATVAFSATGTATLGGTTTAADIAAKDAFNGTANAISITTGNATNAIKAIDAAMKQVNDSSIVQGANQNRFAAVITTLQTSTENQTAARSRIMDTDYAAETATLARGQILQQAGMAMLAQANQLPNGVMALMR